MEIREPREDELRDMRLLSAMSFNVPMTYVDRGPPARPEGALCAYEDGRMLAMTRDIPMREWFGGRAMRCAGISGVATVPEVRGTGLGDTLMRELLSRARGRGAVITTLYPATVPFYRRLGYEYGGEWTIYQIDLDQLPRLESAASVEVFEGDDFSELRGCYEEFVREENGPIEGEQDDGSWWRDRVLTRWVTDAVTRAVVVRGAGGVEGYAAFQQSSRGDWKGYDIECSHLVARTPDAAIALLQYFRRFKGVGRGLKWQGPPNEPLGLLVAEESIRVHRRFMWMARLLDVPAALEARGYPPVSGEAVIDVDDPLFEENRGAFRITADDGKVRVERTEASGALRFGVGALSALFTSYVSPRDLVRTGVIADGDGLPLIGALFAGPKPWMLDHF